MPLEISFLGKFELVKNGRPQRIRSRSAQLLLAYLVLSPGISHRREKIAGMIWPDAPENKSRRNLRHALWQLKKAVGDEYIQADRLSLGFVLPAADCRIDVAVLKNSQEDGPLETLISAVKLYQGELLPGFYEDWVVSEREQVQMVFERRMARLIDRLKSEERWMDVLRWGERWIDRSNSPEPAFRGLMYAYGQLGDKKGIDTAYQRCVETLRDDVGVEPSSETQALYQQALQENLSSIPAEIGSGVSNRKQPPAAAAIHKTSKFALLKRLTGSRLIGREAELAELLHFWCRAQSGQGHFLLLAGEAGIGKTRLLRESIGEVKQQGGLVLQGHYHATLNAPYLGFWEAIREYLRSLPPEEARQISAPFASELVKLVPEVSDYVEAISPNPPLGNVADERLRLFDHIAQFIAKIGMKSPVLFVLEDLHWLDESSALMLEYLVKRTRNMNILFVAAYRDQETAQDHPLHQALLDLNRERLYTRFRLLPLPDKQVRDLIGTLLAGPVEADLERMVSEISSGVPLFVEEIIKSLLEKDSIRLDAGRWQQAGEAVVSVPQSIGLMIKARFAGFSEDCQIALKNAAVLGHHFHLAHLRLLLGWEERRLLDALDEGLRSGIVLDGENQDVGQYRFNHALVQQSLYEELSAWERANTHLGAGQALEKLYPESIDDYLEQLAYHFMQAREAGVLKAAGYLVRVAEKANLVYAHDQALTYLRHGLELLSNSPALPGKEQVELKLLLALGPLAENKTGRWDDEVGNIFARADQLGRQIGASIDEQFAATRGLSLHRFSRSEGEKNAALNSRLVTLAEESGDSSLLLEAYHMIWAQHSAKGNMQEVLKYTKLGRELFDFEAHRHLSLRFGHNPGPCCHSLGGINLWIMGYPDQALEWSREGYRLGEKIGYPIDRLAGIEACLWVYELLREYQKAAEYNEMQLGLAQETKTPMEVTGAQSSKGLALVWQGQHAEGFAHAREAMEQIRSDIHFEPLTFRRFLEVCVLTGRAADGLKVLENKAVWRIFIGGGTFKPEIIRLHGELLLMQDPDNTVEAEDKFQSAIDLARNQEARSFELRAAMSLARLWLAQGRGPQVHELLEPIYTWFSEGFDTPDLIEARQLLGMDLESVS